MQIRPWDTLACCWDIKQPTKKQTNCTTFLIAQLDEHLNFCAVFSLWVYGISFSLVVHLHGLCLNGVHLEATLLCLFCLSDTEIVLPWRLGVYVTKDWCWQLSHGRPLDVTVLDCFIGQSATSEKIASERSKLYRALLFGAFQTSTEVASLSFFGTWVILPDLLHGWTQKLNSCVDADCQCLKWRSIWACCFVWLQARKGLSNIWSGWRVGADLQKLATSGVAWGAGESCLVWIFLMCSAHLPHCLALLVVLPFLCWVSGLSNLVHYSVSLFSFDFFASSVTSFTDLGNLDFPNHFCSAVSCLVRIV